MSDLVVQKSFAPARPQGRARPVSPIGPPHASNPQQDAFARGEAAGSTAGPQLYVKRPQLRRNGTVIKMPNLRFPKE
jgi:hypothetical protein